MKKNTRYSKRSAAMRRIWRELRKHPKRYRERCRKASPFVDLTGKTFGTLRVVKLVGKWRGYHQWLCERPCGHQLKLALPQIRDTAKRSCRACRYWTNRTFEHHGKTRTAPEWAASIGVELKRFADCVNRKGFAYAMKLRPERGLRFLTAGGVTHSQAEWARIMGVSRQLIDARLKKGWSEQDAVLRPLGDSIRPRGRPELFVNHKGKSRSVKEWSRILGVTKGTIFSRLKRGIPIDNDARRSRTPQEAQSA